MKLFIEKLNNAGFNKNHFQLIGLAMIVFVILIFAKSEISLKSLVTQADSKPEILTYEDALKQVSSNNKVNSDQFNKDLENQFALLDRGQADGKVLGEAIGIGAIPDSSELAVPEAFNEYPVVTSNDNSSVAIANYQNAITNIEARYGTVEMLADLNSDDKQMINSSLAKWKNLLLEISKINVPSSLAESHKNKIVYYYAIMKTGEVYAGQLDESKLSYYLKIMLSYANKVQ